MVSIEVKVEIYGKYKPDATQSICMWLMKQTSTRKFGSTILETVVKYIYNFQYFRHLLEQFVVAHQNYESFKKTIIVHTNFF